MHPLRPLTLWLFTCAFLVFSMVVIGGLTRLSESGLSIVEWKLVSGILPPLSETAWQAEFAAYQTSPQFQLVNHAMTLHDFQGIFWLEYLHRLLGRLVGLAYILPLLFFASRKAASPLFLWKMTSISALVGMQGVVGWYMVKSGLIHEPAVSQYRLGFHLCLAILIFSLTLWQWLRLRMPATPTSTVHTKLSWYILTAIFLQIFMGALVAGLDAGLTYNTFPLMDGAWIPTGIYSNTPLWLNHFENIITVQFQHRVFAFVVLGLIGFQAWRIHHHPLTSSASRHLSLILVSICSLQIILGIITLIMVVPIHLAATHQAIAVLTLACAIITHYHLTHSQEIVIKND